MAGTFPLPYTPIANSSGDVGSNGGAAATLPATAGVTNWITAFDISGGGLTTAAIGTVSITGLPTAIGTLTWDFAALASAIGPMTSPNPLRITLPDPLPASAVNTAIVVTVAAIGTGNAHICVTAFGFQR